MIFRLRSAVLIPMALICLVSCSKNKHDLLSKKWKIKELPCGTPSVQWSVAIDSAMQAESSVSLNYNFHPNGTVEMTMGSKIHRNGTWSLDDSGNKLSLHISGKETEEWTITDLTSKALSVTGKDGTQTIFIPK